jgi:transposase
MSCAASAASRPAHARAHGRGYRLPVGAFPSVKLAWADGGYAGKLVTWAKTKLKPRLTLQIVKRPGDLHTFQVLPRRWVVERTLAWITRCRRTVRDYERLPAHHETVVYWAMTITMTRRLGRRPAA